MSNLWYKVKLKELNDEIKIRLIMFGVLYVTRKERKELLLGRQEHIEVSELVYLLLLLLSS